MGFKLKDLVPDIAVEAGKLKRLTPSEVEKSYRKHKHNLRLKELGKERTRLQSNISVAESNLDKLNINILVKSRVASLVASKYKDTYGVEIYNDEEAIRGVRVQELSSKLTPSVIESLSPIQQASWESYVDLLEDLVGNRNKLKKVERELWESKPKNSQ